jgi:hypothetical protein
VRLGVVERWEPGRPEWQRAGELVSMRRYQRALDHLEGLIVARMFELTKMNMSQTGAYFILAFIRNYLTQATGYKMRKHIAKALQSRSQAIRSALEKYNSAARLLPSPRRQLDWKEVVEYAFLADFDLLRDARQDISHRPWATPAGRLAMDLYFKIARAHEEIMRLNVEIRRVATYIRDEDHFLLYSETKVQQTDPRLALQIKLHHNERGRFDRYHRHRLRDIARLDGFSGNILPGTCLATGTGESASVWALLEADSVAVAVGDVENGNEEDTWSEIPADQQEADDEAEADMAMEELIQGMASVMQASSD